MKHRTLPRFWRHYRQLPQEVRDLADKNFELLKADPHHPSLHFKKVGKAKQLWSVRVGAHYRKARLPDPSAHDIDFSPLEQPSLNHLLSARIPAQALLASGQSAYRYDAATAANTDHFGATLAFEIERAGTLHGFGAWFSATLAEGIALSNQPPGISSWDNLLLPLAQPVPVEQGMRIELKLRGRDDSHTQNLWIWNTTVRNGEQEVVRLRQSSVFGQILTGEMLRKLRASWVPALTPKGRIARSVLTLMDQRLSVQEIAERVSQEFPGHFATLDDALRRVRETAQRYGE